MEAKTKRMPRSIKSQLIIKHHENCVLLNSYSSEKKQKTVTKHILTHTFTICSLTCFFIKNILVTFFYIL
uniref:Uncharacterized protein n=1 Tax=Anopheles minimus TaxID=112268 RepID=A0A182WP98_9DIPT